jgi:hypothetical protein
MSTTAPAASDASVSDAVREAFLDSNEADHNATAGLLKDPECRDVIDSGRPDSAPGPFGSLCNVDDNLNHARNELREATAKPLPHPEYPAARLAIDSGRKIRRIVVDADTQVDNEISKLEDAKSLDAAAWSAGVDEKETKSDGELLAADNAT